MLHSHYFKVKISDQYEVTLCNILDDSSIWEIIAKDDDSIRNITNANNDLYNITLFAFRNKHLKTYLHANNTKHDDDCKQLTTRDLDNPIFEWILEKI